MSKAQLLTLWTNNLTVFILVNTGDAFMCDSFRPTIVNFVYWTDSQTSHKNEFVSPSFVSYAAIFL